MEEEKPLLPESTDKLNEKLIRKEKELDILGNIFSQLRSTQDLDVILNQILEQLDRYFGFNHSLILLPSKENQLKVVASYGYPEKGIGAKVQYGKGLIGTAAKRKQIVRIGNLAIHLRYMLEGEFVEKPEDEIIIKLPGLKNPQSLIAIPLLVREELIGILSVESEKINWFKIEDEKIITLIANQAAIAIHNARMYDAERQRFQEMEEINARLSSLTQTQQQTLNLFMKYVPETVVKKALRENPDTMFEGDQLELALLFCDIRDFTPLSEKLKPTQVVNVLNTFYSGMNEVIRKHKGVINQFIGDEIFVSFGAPVPLSNPAESAVCCAFNMIKQLEKINLDLQSSLGITIQVGIGINYGPVIAGNLGCEDKISYSITGDSVNTAKRIESLTHGHPDSILISESVYEKTKHLLNVIAWEPVIVKGKNEQLNLYEVKSVRS